MEVVDRGGRSDDAPTGIARFMSRMDRAAVDVRPQLFAYQFVYELKSDGRRATATNCQAKRDAFI